MRPLPVLPVFFDLAGRRVVIAGDTHAAIWKTELVAAAGAKVTVYAPDPPEELDALAANPPAGHIAIVRRAWREADLCGAALAIAALEDGEAETFAAAADRQGVPFNVIDRPEVSPIHFGAIVNRAPVTIAISTGGTAPVLGQAIRGKIETLLPPSLGAWAAAAKRVRRKILSRGAAVAAQRELWQRYAREALAARQAPSDDDIARLLDAAPGADGSVVLVGAGPGDPDLLTLKGMRALQTADVILYDRLVGAEVLELARREAKRILVGKVAGGPRVRQTDINALMVALARQGKRVVRLKGGDPMIFGRAAEEIAACRAAGIPVEVVPGITAALGAAAELAQPLTGRHGARRVQFVTGATATGSPPEFDWASVADATTTTAFYMSGRAFADLLPKLLAAGLDPATPAFVSAAATTPRARHARTPVARIPHRLAGLAGNDPCLIVVGRSLMFGDGASDAEEQTLPPAETELNLGA
jgi:uroporphyrin-III C-methyltransferase/precorrin-2 dehydrogenase/sirohydrochlorin ferrochelatase